MSIRRDLAKNIITVEKANFPRQAVENANLAILDTFGVMLAGSVHEGSAKLRRAHLPTAAPGPGSICGSGLRCNLLDATLLNGTAAHNLDYDDFNSQFRGHPSVAILPALLAVAEERGASGREIVHAYIAGFEAGGRIGMGVAPHQYNIGWHPTTTVGIFTAVAASSILTGACFIRSKKQLPKL